VHLFEAGDLLGVLLLQLSEVRAAVLLPEVHLGLVLHRE
jgi:hypothetical protein